MGVTNLWQILAPIQSHRSLSSLAGETLAVDLAGWVVEAQTVKQMQVLVVRPHLRNIFFRVSQLTQLGIKLVFVVDGTPPELKYEAMQKRQQARFGGTARQAVGSKPRKTTRSRFKTCLKECCEMLQYMGMACVQADGEAEATCAQLNQSGVVDAVLTDDGDCFLYGARVVYRNFSLNVKDPHVERYRMTDCEHKLKLDRKKLIALALLLGCDYVPRGVPGIGMQTAMELMTSYNTDDILERFQEWRVEGVTHSSIKLLHCGNCKHPGKERVHEKTGCSEPQHYDYQCPCPRHQQQGKAVETNIKNKALAVPEFPQTDVIAEYLRTDSLPTASLQWSRPTLQPLQKFNLTKLEWPEDYTREKVVPLMTYWDQRDIIQNGGCNTHLRPHRIVKSRVRRGILCYEVLWEKEINDTDFEQDFYTTVETAELFKDCFPSLVQDFEIQKSQKTVTKPRKGHKKKANLIEETKADTVDTLTSAISGLTLLTHCTEKPKSVPGLDHSSSVENLYNITQVDLNNEPLNKTNNPKCQINKLDDSQRISQATSLVSSDSEDEILPLGQRLNSRTFTHVPNFMVAVASDSQIRQPSHAEVKVKNDQEHKSNRKSPQHEISSPSSLLCAYNSNKPDNQIKHSTPSNITGNLSRCDRSADMFDSPETDTVKNMPLRDLSATKLLLTSSSRTNSNTMSSCEHIGELSLSNLYVNPDLSLGQIGNFKLLSPGNLIDVSSIDVTTPVPSVVSYTNSLLYNPKYENKNNSEIHDTSLSSPMPLAERLKQRLESNKKIKQNKTGEPGQQNMMLCQSNPRTAISGIFNTTDIIIIE